MYEYLPMIRLKKFFISLLVIIPIISIGFWEALKTWPKTAEFNWDSTAKMGNTTVNEINEWSKTFTDSLNWILHLPQKDEYITSLWYIMAMIQIAINWLLWILAFIALIYMLYCGFLVFSSWSDDKNAAKGKKWIWTAAIALAGIGISRLIISMILWLINYITTF